LADAASTPGKTKTKSAPQAGDVKDPSKPGDAKPPGENTNPLGANPSVNDVESSFNEGSETADADGEDPEASPRPPAPLRLATTTVNGGGPPPAPSQDAPADDDADEAPSMTKEELAKAIDEQNKLLAEFDEVAGKITEVLENLEGSTFVKRLKAASRLQTSVAGDLIETVGETFGLERDEIEDASYDGTVTSVALRETDGSRKASVIQSDLGAYVDRLEERGSDFGKYQKVLEDMKDKSPTADLSGISDDTEGGRPGAALANAEVWSDTFDRWAEQLVGPG